MNTLGTKGAGPINTPQVFQGVKVQMGGLYLTQTIPHS